MSTASAQPSPTGSWNAQVKPQTQARTPGAEVVVRTPEGELSEELQNEAYEAIALPRTNDNPFPTARRYQRDLRRAFSDVRAQPEDTPWACKPCGAAQPGST